jgi:SpoVK/Ycf46/Vps4 family AAA+-type ATPase
MDSTFLQLKPRALREVIATPEIPWENMQPARLDRPNTGGATEAEAQIRLKEIAGYDEIKRLVDDLILWPEKNRRFIKVSRTSGILFFGPPGCGKSRLARAIAGELEQEVRLLAPADLRGVYISWGQVMIREHFDWVAENERRMLVIDELDAVARSRRNNGNMHTDEMADVNELLVQLDRVSRLGRIVVGTTNYVGSLDDAIIRSGRFGTFIPVPPPNLDAAAKIATYYLSAVTSAGDGVRPRVEALAVGEVRSLLEAAIGECKQEQRFYCGADLEEAVIRTYRRCCRKAMPEGWLKDREALTITLTAEELGRSFREVRKSIDEQSLHEFIKDVDRFCGSAVARDMRGGLKGE